MDIMTINFEENIIIELGNEKIQLVAFRTTEHGNVKFGIEASRSIKIHREEIYHAIRAKEKLLEELTD